MRTPLLLPMVRYRFQKMKVHGEMQGVICHCSFKHSIVLKQISARRGTLCIIDVTAVDVETELAKQDAIELEGKVLNPAKRRWCLTLS